MVKTYKPQKTAAFNFRLKPEIRQVLQEQAAKEGVSQSSLAERYMEEAMRARKLVR